MAGALASTNSPYDSSGTDDPRSGIALERRAPGWFRHSRSAVLRPKPNGFKQVRVTFAQPQRLAVREREGYRPWHCPLDEETLEEPNGIAWLAAID